MMSWPGHEGLHFVQILTENEEEICKIGATVFMLNANFKPQ